MKFCITDALGQGCSTRSPSRSALSACMLLLSWSTSCSAQATNTMVGYTLWSATMDAAVNVGLQPLNATLSPGSSIYWMWDMYGRIQSLGGGYGILASGSPAYAGPTVSTTLTGGVSAQTSVCYGYTSTPPAQWTQSIFCNASTNDLSILNSANPVQTLAQKGSSINSSSQQSGITWPASIGYIPGNSLNVGVNGRNGTLYWYVMLNSNTGSPAPTVNVAFSPTSSTSWTNGGGVRFPSPSLSLSPPALSPATLSPPAQSPPPQSPGTVAPPPGTSPSGGLPPPPFNWSRFPQFSVVPAPPNAGPVAACNSMLVALMAAVCILFGALN